MVHKLKRQEQPSNQNLLKYNKNNKIKNKNNNNNNNREPFVLFTQHTDQEFLGCQSAVTAAQDGHLGESFHLNFFLA